MTTYEPPAERSIAHLPTDATKLGVDTEGHIHIYSRIRDQVYVLNDTHLDDVQDLDGRGLRKYIGFVSDRRGWSKLAYSENGLAGLLQLREDA